MTKTTRRWISLLMCAVLLISYIPAVRVAAAEPQAQSNTMTAVTDPGTAETWESMMGTDADGNRYAGRVWADKSVYKQGDTVVLNTNDQAGASFVVDNLSEDEAFQIVFSALGSSMTTTTTTSKAGPMDVILVLDNSVSMNTTSGGTTRMQKVIEAANTMLTDLLADNKDVRLGIVAYAENASIVLPFGDYNDGVVLRVNSYTGTGSRNGVISAYTTAGQRINSSYQSAGYANYTNTQAGFAMGMEMLANANTTQNRKPVVILLTDGSANTALDTLFYNNRTGTTRQVYHASNIDPMIALSTLLSNAYNKAVVEKKYGKNPMVYGIGVDLSATDGSNAIINPKDNFNSNNRNSNIVAAYNAYTNTWSQGSNISTSSGGYTFHFRHDYPEAGIADADVIDNIYYVDTYYPVSGAQLGDTFDQIYEELSSGVFNPISSTTVTEGGTGEEDTPLIYVDYIGQYMEVKEIQTITLFGSSYGVTKGTTITGTDKDINDNTVPVTITSYTVARGTGKNPATNENWDTTRNIEIQVVEYEDNTQKLEIRIDQEILPILLEKVDDRNINDQHTATITEIGQSPLRVFYTVGLDADILLPNGEVDITKIDSSYSSNINGNEVTFYSNLYGVKNSIASGKGDAHVGFKPSKQNRYYYHQSRQDIFTAVSRKDGASISWDSSEYGVPYKKDTFNFTWLTYEEYTRLEGQGLDNQEVYTYVTYYHPTPSTTDAANAAEEVTYLVYTKWGYLKESVAFYDYNADTYINYHENSSYTTGEVGYAIPVDKVAATIAAYKAANPNAQIYGVLGMESLRTSRLHNMTVEKGAGNNPTETATIRYAPEYTYETASQHHDNDVVIWLGNNGKLTVEVDTGIALSKKVTEPIGNANDTYDLTVTIPAGVAATPLVEDANGNVVASTYSGNVLTIPVKANQTVYITGIPAGTVCSIGEIIPAGKDYYISSKTDTVTVPTLAQVTAGAAQFAPATVTNSPNKYGDLTIIKDISHNLSVEPEAMKDKTFTFRVQLDPIPANKTYALDKENASLVTESQITVADDGTFTVKLKDNESVTILGLPAGTGYTVTETDVPQGYTNTSGVVTGTILPDGDHDAHFVNTYGATSIYPEIDITGTKTVVDPHGTYTDNENFVFSLSMYNGSTYNELATAGARNGESFNFALDELLPAPLNVGEYYFRVTEYAGTTPGMTYDATRGLFKVTVTDHDADGVLEYTVADAGNTTVSGNTVTKNFTNTYDVERTCVDINITKVLTNNTGVNLPLNIFHFTQVNTGKPAGDADIPNKTVTTDASGKAVIRLSNLGPGEYTYTLTEVDGGIPGMIYDTAVRAITVTVTEEGGVLTATTQIDGIATNEVTFNNEYKLTKVSHTISGTKLLNGRTLEDGEFRFALYKTDSSFLLADNAVAEQTVSNTGNTFAFSQIDFTKVGTYYYSVKEVVPDTKLPGVTYDTTHYHITVTVTVDGDHLKKDVVVNKIGHNEDTSGDLVFVNTYTAKATELAISGTKVLTGRGQQADEFTFRLYDENGIQIDETTNKADGTFTFGAISYDAVGQYHYTVKEVAGNAPGVAYDDQEISVTVTVTDQGAALSAAADKTAEEVVFTNTYTPAAATVTFHGTKTLKGGTLETDQFTFFLYETDHAFDITGKTPSSASNKADGTFGFASITYQTAGTHFYVIEEKTAEPLEGIVYDRTSHQLMVQVIDIGDGQLRASVTVLDTAQKIGYAASVAMAVKFTNATFEQAAQKEVFLDSQTTMIDGQKVSAGDVLTYHITYTNYTGQPVVADIMDTIPANTTYVEGSADKGGTYAGTHVNWILNVAAGESVTVSFQVKVDAEEVIVSNTAVIRDGVNTYDTNEVVNHTIEEAFVKDVFVTEDITTSVGGQKVEAGNELLYEIRFTNATAETVDITITDAIPTNTAYVDGSADNGGLYENGVITWTLENVPAWETVTVSFKVKVNENIGDATIRNQATATDGNNQFESNLVSNYTKEETPEPENGGGTPGNPQTGDESLLQPWAVLMVVSMGGILTMSFLAKKKPEEV